MQGIIILDNQGIPIRSQGLDNAATVQHAALLTHFVAKAKAAVKQLDRDNDLSFLRIRSKKHEIMVAPDREYCLIVIQNPSTQ